MEAIPFFVWAGSILVLWMLFYAAYRVSHASGRRLFTWLSARASERDFFTKLFPARFQPRTPYLKLGLLLLAGAIVVFITGDWFVDIAEEVTANSETIRTLDENARAWAVEHRRDTMLLFVLFVTTVSQPGGLGIIAAGMAVFCLFRKRRDLAFFVAASSLGGALLNVLLKEWFKRDRPDLAVALSDAPGYSFPSGHTMGSMIVIGSIVWAILRLSHSRAAKTFSLAAGISSILAISSSRIYLGVHWLTDVAAGLAAGVTWLVFAIVIWEASRRLHFTRAAAKAHLGSAGVGSEPGNSTH
ncbi:MAG: phosphatase PAP2 family protein [Acidobacteria bacterium]|nr:phosphatase PAP2 family protein [Acidobacteriota bacterium]